MREQLGKCKFDGIPLYGLWAPLYDKRSRCKFDGSKIWAKALGIPLLWMIAFLSRTAGTLSRVYTLADYLGHGAVYEITVDASPLRLGGYLSIDGVIQEGFTSPIN